MIRITLKAGIVAAIAIVWASAAQAGGWYHMPTSFCQCMGWGFGPGYHAPLVLERGGCMRPIMPNRVIRVREAPFGVGVGCYDCDPYGMTQLPGYENSPMPFAEPPATEAAVPASKPPVTPIANPNASALARPLPPLFPPPPLVVPVR